MREIELQHNNGTYYTIEFDFTKGFAGTYFDAPEEHELTLYDIYDEEGEIVKDKSIYSYFDEEIYDLINAGEFD